MNELETAGIAKVASGTVVSQCGGSNAGSMVSGDGDHSNRDPTQERLL